MDPTSRREPTQPNGELARLRLYQLISPALPVGAFSYSEGLEVLVQKGRLGDAAAVEAWLEAELTRGALRLEAASLPGLMALLRSWQEACGRDDNAASQARRQLIERDGWLLAQREAAELRAQQRQMGGSLLQLLADLGWPLGEPPALNQPPAPSAPAFRSRPTPATQPTDAARSTAVAGTTAVAGRKAGAGRTTGAGATAFAWPTAFAWSGVCLAVPPELLIEAYLYGWVANQLSAAVRLVPLGPTEAQRLQLRLAPKIASEAIALAAADPDKLWTGGVGAGLAQLGHSGLYSRLFRS